MKKYIFYIALSFLITTSLSARKTGCEGNCENGLGNGPIQIKLPMKVNGLKHKNKAKEPKLGLMDIFTKVNLKIVSGMVKEF